MYTERVSRNLKRVIEAHGFRIVQSGDATIKSVCPRHLHSVSKGQAAITIKKLEALADEIGADMMDFFKE